MRRRHPSTRRLIATTARASLVAAAVAVALHAPGPRAQTVRTERPWEGWHQPLADGVIGLRFGMDRVSVADRLGERGFEGASSRAGTLRYRGRLLDEPVTVLVGFNDDLVARAGGRLNEIQLHWNTTGLARLPLRLFEQLDTLLENRYGVPLAVEDDGLNALETGSGLRRKLYEGPEVRALLELRSPRPERFDLVLRLDSPQLAVAAEPES